LASGRHSPGGQAASLIKAVAFLRQMQKPLRTWGPEASPRSYIELELEDIKMANNLASQLLGHGLDELSRPEHDLLLLMEKLLSRSGDPEGKPPAVSSFTRRQIRELTGWSNTRVHRYLRELIESVSCA
jgi:DNA primase